MLAEAGGPRAGAGRIFPAAGCFSPQPRIKCPENETGGTGNPELLAPLLNPEFCSVQGKEEKMLLEREVRFPFFFFFFYNFKYNTEYKLILH